MIISRNLLMSSSVALHVVIMVATDRPTRRGDASVDKELAAEGTVGLWVQGETLTC